MDDIEAAKMIATLDGDINAEVTEIQRRQERVDAMRQVRDGLTKLYPSAVVPAEADEPDTTPGVVIVDRPSIPEGARRVFLEHPGRWFSPAEMVAELKERNWMPNATDPDAAARVALRRLTKAGELRKRVRDGRTAEYAPIINDELADNPRPDLAFLFRKREAAG